MRPLPAIVADEVVNTCIADHNRPMNPEYPDSGETIVDTARIVNVGPGHEPHNPRSGICPTCGRLSGMSDQYAGLDFADRLEARACHEHADWVIELRYHVVRDTDVRWPVVDREYAATYGVTVQGDRLDVACWMD